MLKSFQIYNTLQSSSEFPKYSVFLGVKSKDWQSCLLTFSTRNLRQVVKLGSKIPDEAGLTTESLTIERKFLKTSCQQEVQKKNYHVAVVSLLLLLSDEFSVSQSSGFRENPFFPVFIPLVHDSDRILVARQVVPILQVFFYLYREYQSIEIQPCLRLQQKTV